jgi:hypothetical protein
MKIQELISFIKSLVPGVYYPNTFPLSAANECFVVKLSGGLAPDEWTGKKQPIFQILVRGEKNGHASLEEKAYLLHNALMNKRNCIIGEESVVVIRAINSVPFYIGNDENNRPIYSMNFECVVRPKVKAAFLF